MTNNSNSVRFSLNHINRTNAHRIVYHDFHVFFTHITQKFITRSSSSITHTHKHTHPLNGPFSGTNQVSQFRICNLDFTVKSKRQWVADWQWHQLGHMQVCTALQTDNHTSTPPLSFLQAWCLSCHPTNSIRAHHNILCNVRIYSSGTRT